MHMKPARISTMQAQGGLQQHNMQRARISVPAQQHLEDSITIDPTNESEDEAPAVQTDLQHVKQLRHQRRQLKRLFEWLTSEHSNCDSNASCDGNNSSATSEQGLSQVPGAAVEQQHMTAAAAAGRVGSSKRARHGKEPCSPACQAVADTAGAGAATSRSQPATATDSLLINNSGSTDAGKDDPGDGVSNDGSCRSDSAGEQYFSFDSHRPEDKKPSGTHSGDRGSQKSVSVIVIDDDSDADDAICMQQRKLMQQPAGAETLPSTGPCRTSTATLIPTLASSKLAAGQAPVVLQSQQCGNADQQPDESSDLIIVSQMSLPGRQHERTMQEADTVRRYSLHQVPQRLAMQPSQQKQQRQFTCSTRRCLLPQQQQQQQPVAAYSPSNNRSSHQSQLLGWAGHIFRCPHVEVRFLAQHIFRKCITHMQQLLQPLPSMQLCRVRFSISEVAMLMSVWIAIKLEGCRGEDPSCSWLAE